VNGLMRVLGFNGEHPEPGTGHYLLGKGYRAFNPVLMRFHSPDSLSPFGAGGLNPYAYCLGDPINRRDPTGHFSWQSVVGIGMGVLGIGLSIATMGAATPLAIAALTTGVVSNAAGIAQAALEDAVPGVSSTLGWASLGLGVASGGFGMAAGFSKVGNRVQGAFKSGLSGKGAGAAARMWEGTSVPSLFEKSLSGLPGNHILALADTSKAASTSVQRWDDLFGLTNALRLFSRGGIDTLELAAQGSVNGVLPARATYMLDHMSRYRPVMDSVSIRGVATRVQQFHAERNFVLPQGRRGAVYLGR
jgi:RHS repeat-associated protein